MNTKGLCVVVGVCLRCFRDRVVGFNVGGRTDKVGTVVMEPCTCQPSFSRTEPTDSGYTEHIVTGVK